MDFNSNFSSSISNKLYFRRILSFRNAVQNHCQGLDFYRHAHLDFPQCGGRENKFGTKIFFMRMKKKQVADLFFLPYQPLVPLCGRMKSPCGKRSTYLRDKKKGRTHRRRAFLLWSYCKETAFRGEMHVECGKVLRVVAARRQGKVAKPQPREAKRLLKIIFSDISPQRRRTQKKIVSSQYDT